MFVGITIGRAYIWQIYGIYMADISDELIGKVKGFDTTFSKSYVNLKSPKKS